MDAGLCSARETDGNLEHHLQYSSCCLSLQTVSYSTRLRKLGAKLKRRKIWTVWTRATLFRDREDEAGRQTTPPLFLHPTRNNAALTHKRGALRSNVLKTIVRAAPTKNMKMSFSFRHREVGSGSSTIFRRHDVVAAVAVLFLDNIAVSYLSRRSSLILLQETKSTAWRTRATPKSVLEQRRDACITKRGLSTRPRVLLQLFDEKQTRRCKKVYIV